MLSNGAGRRGQSPSSKQLYYCAGRRRAPEPAHSNAGALAPGNPPLWGHQRRLGNRPSDIRASKFLLRVSLGLGGWKTLGLLVNSSQSVCLVVPLLPSQDKGANCDSLGEKPFLCLLASGAGSLAHGLHPLLEVPESLWQIPEALP